MRWCRRRPLLAGLLASIAMLLMAVLALTTVWAVSNSQLAGKTLESRNRLVRVLENEGQDYLEANDLLRSLPWFTQALQVDEKQPSRHRLRLGQILNSAHLESAVGGRQRRDIHPTESQWTACGRR